VERSREMQACSKIAKPPASRIAYCFMIERHSFAPGSPKDDGGSGVVDNTAILLMAKSLLRFLTSGNFDSRHNLNFRCRCPVRAANTHNKFERWGAPRPQERPF